MKNNFNLDQIGKQMPYTVPEGFMDEIENNVLAAVKKQRTTDMRKRVIFAAAGFAAAACIALALIQNAPTANHAQPVDFQQLESAFSKLSHADQKYLLNVYNNDIFINE